MPDAPNVLLITADDLNWNSVGAWGSPVEATPNIDRLAADGVRFDCAHVNIAVCQPSRSALMSGRYPHTSGGEGFFRLRERNVPILPELLRAAGYRVGILGKVKHSTPHAHFRWDTTFDREDLGSGRSPGEYRRRAAEFIAEAKNAGKRFFLMANSHDPHRPFFGNDSREWYDPARTKPPAEEPSRVFAPEEVEVPGFLPEVPEVRREIAEYYGSVRRCDDTVGALLEVLAESGTEEDTLVVFLSDNGMALPFAKTNCYLHSTKTPWAVRWPARVAAGRAESEQLISGVDLLPTILEACGLEVPDGVDGRSFLPLLEGRGDDSRRYVFTQFFQTAGRRNYPMRCVQTPRFGYIFNPWHDGEREFVNESQSGRSFAAMQEAAADDPEIAARVKLFLYRVPEEFYDFEADPDALRNLIDDPSVAPELARLRGELESWMERTGDPALGAFRARDSRGALEEHMRELRELLGDRED